MNNIWLEYMGELNSLGNVGESSLPIGSAFKGMQVDISNSGLYDPGLRITEYTLGTELFVCCWSNFILQQVSLYALDPPGFVI